MPSNKELLLSACELVGSSLALAGGQEGAAAEFRAVRPNLSTSQLMPDAKRIRARLLRVSGEFAVIVTGVLVALAAESQMESRGEAIRANSAIPLMIEDLEADSVRMAAFATHIPRHDTTYATLLMTRPGVEISPDSVVSLVFGLSVGQDFAPSRATYESLLDTDGIRHLGELDLQSDLMRYYQEHQANVLSWYEWYTEHFTRFQHLVGRHLSSETSTLEEGLRGWTQIPTTVATSWPEFRGDADLMAQIGLMNTYEGILGSAIAAAQDENASLRRRLHAIRR